MAKTSGPRGDATARNAVRILTMIGKAVLLVALVVVLYVAFEEYRSQPTTSGAPSGAGGEP